MPRNDGSEQAELNESNLFEIQKLKATNTTLLQALQVIAKHDGSDNFLVNHLVGIATEAIRIVGDR